MPAHIGARDDPDESVARRRGEQQQRLVRLQPTLGLFDGDRRLADQPGIIGELRRDRPVEFSDLAGDRRRLGAKRLLHLRIARGSRLRNGRDEQLVDRHRLLAQILPLANPRRQIAAAGRDPRRHAGDGTRRLFVADPLRGFERAGPHRCSFLAVGFRQPIGGDDGSGKRIGRAGGLEIGCRLPLAGFGCTADENFRRATERVVGARPVIRIQIVGTDIVETVGDIGMFFAQRAHPNLQRPLQQRFRIACAPETVENHAEIVQAVGDQRMLPTERLLTDRKRTARQRLGFAVTLVVDNQRREIVEGDRDIEMFRTKALFANGDRAAKQRLRLGLAAGSRHGVGEVVQRNRDIGMIRAERLFLDRQRARQQAFGLRCPPLPREHERQIVQARSDVRMIGSQRLLPDRQRAPRQLLGLLQPCLLSAEFAEVIQRRRQIDAVAAMALLLQTERFGVSLLGQLQPSLRLIDLGDVVERNRHHDVGLPLRIPEHLQRAAEQIERLGLPQLAVTKIAELHARLRGAEIVGTGAGFADAQGARHVALGILQAVLAERDLAEQTEHRADVGMTGTKRLLADRERASQIAFSIRGFALDLLCLRQHDKRGCGQHRLAARRPLRFGV